MKAAEDSDSRQSDTRQARAAARRMQAEQWPIERFKLGSEPAFDQRVFSTINERVELTLKLSERAFRLSNKPWPDYTRDTMPGRLIHRAT